MNIASIYWVPNKSTPLIWYMLINETHQILIPPSCISANNIKENLDTIFAEFNLASHNGYNVNYKSIFKQFKRHRTDSADFDNEINQQIESRNLQSDKKQSKIKKDARSLLKRALAKLHIPIEPNESIDLWAISLKVGQKESSVRKAIEKLWKINKSIKRFDKDNKKLFSEFFTQLKE
ncbi:hypothetical protein ELY21_11470 [Legionella sp. km535]|uniref:hypothetical protein n=1 Tax=Legionella sp. km535 TaxID=2498107 RepID=UPI000F8D0BB6|nr:hypothetical protein [Legionella sp. km535]RUR17184.1 hypothetical protein ELY21_11470 [Legionella sp. km535]